MEQQGSTGHRMILQSEHVINFAVDLKDHGSKSVEVYTGVVVGASRGMLMSAQPQASTCFFTPTVNGGGHESICGLRSFQVPVIDRPSLSVRV